MKRICKIRPCCIYTYFQSREISQIFGIKYAIKYFKETTIISITCITNIYIFVNREKSVRSNRLLSSFRTSAFISVFFPFSIRLPLEIFFFYLKMKHKSNIEMTNRFNNDLQCSVKFLHAIIPIKFLSDINFWFNNPHTLSGICYNWAKYREKKSVIHMFQLFCFCCLELFWKIVDVKGKVNVEVNL